MIDYELYKNNIIQASKNARQATNIDDALEIQANGMMIALQVAITQAVVNTTVATAGTAVAQTGTGVGVIV